MSDAVSLFHQYQSLRARWAELPLAEAAPLAAEASCVLASLISRPASCPAGHLAKLTLALELLEEELPGSTALALIRSASMDESFVQPCA